MIIVADTCVVVTPILPGEAGRDPDDQLRQVRALRAVEHRLLGVVRLDGRLRGERGHAARRSSECRRGERAGGGAAARARGDCDGARADRADQLLGRRRSEDGRDRRSAPSGDAASRSPASVLLVPETVGSSSAAAILLELVHARRAPAAIVLHEPDAILLLGLIVAKEMGYETPIALRLDRDQFAALDGRQLSISDHRPDRRFVTGTVSPAVTISAS